MSSRIWIHFARLLLLIGLWPGGDVLAQSPLEDVRDGIPYFLNNVTSDQYDAHHQNWAVVEDDRGVVYVANTHGVLEYDGSSWRLISVGSGAVVRSLDADERGRVYVGAAGELGYLAPDSTGTMRFVSLLDQIPSGHRSFDDVWGTHVTENGVYFQTWRHLIRWSGDGVHVIETEDEVLTSFSVRGQLYLWQRNNGIVTPQGDSLAPTSGFDRLRDKPVYAMLPSGADNIVIGTFADGLFLYDGERVDRLPSELNTFLTTNKLYDGVRLFEDVYAFGTLDGGIGVVDLRTGDTHVLDASRGLQDERVYGLYADDQGGLWAALYNGIARTIVPSPVAVFDKRRGLKGAVQTLEHHGGTLYAATTRGLFRRERSTSAAGSDVRFVRVPGTPKNAHWSLLSVDNELLAASNDRVYAVTDTGVRNIFTDLAFGLHRSKVNPRRVFVGLKNGIMSLHRTAEVWATETRIEGVTEEVRSLAQDSTGIVWVGTRYEGVIRLDFSNGFSSRPPMSKFGVEEGLPEGPVLVSEMSGRILVITRQGAYRHHRDGMGQLVFKPDSSLAPLFRGRSRPLSLVRGGQHDSIWMVFDEVVEMHRRTRDGSYREHPARSLMFPNTKILEVYPEDRYVWLGAKDGLFRYNPGLDTLVHPPGVTLVREVITNDDSLVFGGTHPTAVRGHGITDPGDRGSTRMVSLPYRSNNLRFTYASPGHTKPTATRYQYLLEGFDQGWSRWTTETMKEYTNLDEGAYRFRVRARTVSGAVTEEGVFAFEVLPPWYRTLWAYGLYGIALVGALYGYGRYRASVSARKLEQERRVTERLKEANAELRRANRLKDEFLANISHELRTPLASILGFADILDEELEEPQREFVQLIRESGDRLYNTLDALLDLAKFRAGMVELDYSTVDLVDEVDSVLQIFKPRAREKGLALDLAADEPSIQADLDTFCLERIMTNLIGNAIKFTEEGGVTVSVRQMEDEVEIRVADTGIGIEEDFLPNIFEAFRQESSGLSRSHQGVGLGLAITKRMVDLMAGEIEVQSRKGEGTEFILTFLRSQAQESASTNGVVDAMLSREAEPSA